MIASVLIDKIEMKIKCERQSCWLYSGEKLHDEDNWQKFEGKIEQNHRVPRLIYQEMHTEENEVTAYNWVTWQSQWIEDNL